MEKTVHGDDMKIAPKSGVIGGYWIVRDWKRLNLGNDDDFGDKKDWDTAIQIFIDRIQGRFLDAIETLKTTDETSKVYRFGFASMSLICLLIETLAQFYEGITRRKSEKSDYVNFLFSKSFILKNHFEEDIAEKFYQTIRCGLLHRAETNKNSLIKYKKYDDPNLPFEKINDGIIVYWSAFYDLLRQEFQAYINNLRDENQTDLRKNFRKKMNHICRIGIEA